MPNNLLPFAVYAALAFKLINWRVGYSRVSSYAYLALEPGLLQIGSMFLAYRLEINILKFWPEFLNLRTGWSLSLCFVFSFDGTR